MSKKRTLRKLKIDEISGVSAGAGIGCRVLLLKRHVVEEDDMKAEKLARLRKKSSPEYLAKRAEKKVLKGVAAAVAEFRKTDTSLTDEQALLKLARSREHADLWAAYREMAGNGVVKAAGFWPIMTERVAPKPVVAAPSLSGGATGGTDDKSLDELVAEYRKTFPELSEAAAYGKVMRTVEGASAYRREREARMGRPPMTGASYPAPELVR
jgi:hypothetical protein